MLTELPSPSWKPQQLLTRALLRPGHPYHTKPDLLLPPKDHVHAPKLFSHGLIWTCTALLAWILFIEKYYACSSYIVYVALQLCKHFGIMMCQFQMDFATPAQNQPPYPTPRRLAIFSRVSQGCHREVARNACYKAVCMCVGGKVPCFYYSHFRPHAEKSAKTQIQTSYQQAYAPAWL